MYPGCPEILFCLLVYMTTAPPLIVSSILKHSLLRNGTRSLTHSLQESPAVCAPETNATYPPPHPEVKEISLVWSGLCSSLVRAVSCPCMRAIDRSSHAGYRPILLLTSLDYTRSWPIRTMRPSAHIHPSKNSHPNDPSHIPTPPPGRL